MATLADYMQFLHADIPGDVIADEAFERVLDLTSHFSASLANRTFCLEIHLHEPTPFPDFSIHFPIRDLGRQQLLHLSSGEDHPSNQRHRDLWLQIAQFAALALDPASLLQQYTDHIWLEFDLDQPVSSGPVPALFYAGLQTSERIPPILQAMAAIFYGPETSLTLMQSVTSAIELIPSHAQVNQVGFGLLRDQNVVRLQIMGMSPQNIPTYLEEVGWEYPIAPLLPMLERLSRCDLLALCIDIAARSLPKIGFECYLSRHDTRWQLLLDDLVARDLCYPAKRDFLVSCPGVKLYQRTEEISITQRRLSHLKIAYHPEQVASPFEAKAYLFYYPAWTTIHTTDKQVFHSR